MIVARMISYSAVGPNAQEQLQNQLGHSCPDGAIYLSDKCSIQMHVETLVKPPGLEIGREWRGPRLIEDYHTIIYRNMIKKILTNPSLETLTAEELSEIESIKMEIGL